MTEQKTPRRIGRPVSYPGAERTTVYLTPEEKQRLRDLGHGNVTEAIRRLLKIAA